MHKVPKKEGVVLGMRAWYEVDHGSRVQDPCSQNNSLLSPLKDLLKFCSFEQEKRDLTHMGHLLLRYEGKARQGY
jgi:hypothetical protein